MAGSGVSDRGRNGLRYTDKKQVFKGASWVEPQGSISLFEDFLGPATAAASDIVMAGNAHIFQSGTALTDAVIAPTAGPAPIGFGGWIQGKTDDVDGEIDSVALGQFPWMRPDQVGNGMMVAEVGCVIPPALTARGYLFGFTDVVHEGTGDGALSIVTGITLVAGNSSADGAGFVYSSLATDVDGFYMGAVKATVVGTAVLTSAGSLESVAVDNYIKLRVEVDTDGDVYFYGAEDLGTANRRIEPVFQGSQAAAITATTLQFPMFSAHSTTTTGVEWEVDYIFGAIAG